MELARRTLIILIIWLFSVQLSGGEPSVWGSAFSDPDLTWHKVPPGWIPRPIKHEPGAHRADLAVTLDQNLYPALLPLIREYAAERDLAIAVQKGTCGISEGLLYRKAVDIAGFCCPPALSDRLPNLRFHTLSIGAIAILVHPDNPLEGLSVAQARQIFRGEIQDWGMIEGRMAPGSRKPIHVIGRLHCKLRPGHWRLLLDDEDLFAPDLLDVATIEDMLASVAADPFAIGYETLWMLREHRYPRRAKTLALGGVGPDDRGALAQGRYPLYRVYNVTTWGGAAASPLAQALIGHLQGQMAELDAKFAMVPASQLRRNGWKFKDDELTGEPD